MKPGKNVVYVAGRPKVASEADYIRSWSHPRQLVETTMSGHLEFRSGSILLRLTRWDKTASKTSQARTKAAAPQYIGPTTSTASKFVHALPQTGLISSAT